MIILYDLSSKLIDTIFTIKFGLIFIRGNNHKFQNQVNECENSNL